MHPTKDIVATGQVAREPEIHVWDVEGLTTISIFKGAHDRGVCALEFTGDGKRLLSVGLEDDHRVAVWDWRRGECLSQVGCFIKSSFRLSRAGNRIKNIKG